MPYGGYLIVSVDELEGVEAGPVQQQYSAGRLHHHNRGAVTSLLEGLQLAGPGVTEARAWRAPALIPDHHERRGRIWAAVGRKAGDAG